MTQEDRSETIQLIKEALEVVLEKRDDRMVKIMKDIVQNIVQEQDKKFQQGLQKQTDRFLEALKPYEKKTEEHEEK